MRWMGQSTSPSLWRVRFETVIVVFALVWVRVLGRVGVVRLAAAVVVVVAVRPGARAAHGRGRGDEDAVDGEHVTGAEEMKEHSAQHVHQQHDDDDAQQCVARLHHHGRRGIQHRLKVLRHAPLKHTWLVTCENINSDKRADDISCFFHIQVSAKQQLFTCAAKETRRHTGRQIRRRRFTLILC